MFNTDTQAAFIDPVSELVILDPARIRSLYNRFAQWGATYQDRVRDLTALGITFSDWRENFPARTNARYQEYWDELYSFLPVPRQVSDEWGTGLLPTWENFVAGVLSVWDETGIPDEQLGGNWMQDFAIYYLATNGVPLPDPSLDLMLTVWAVNGMFQLEICLTLLNCWNLDARGRPPGS